MSLHFPLMVNGTVIGAFVARRIQGGTNPDDQNLYECSVHGGDDPADVFTVTHRYGDGAWALVATALTEYRRKVQEKK